MKARSNVEWQKWAQDDPLYGIATRRGRSRDGVRPWTFDEFYEYGALNWSEYYPRWCRYGVDQKSCVEIGCGAGRITRQLVRCFGSVCGVDISPEMLTLARCNVAAARFVLADGTNIPLPDASVSAVFSCEVFQHFDDRSIALSYFREMHRVLCPGGTCMIQLPIVVLPLHRSFPAMGTLQHLLWRIGENWVRGKTTIKRWLITHRNRRSFIHLIQYDPQWLVQNLSMMGFADVEIQMFAITGDPGEEYLDSFLLARKSSTTIHR